jgi:hypothetical protein
MNPSAASKTNKKPKPMKKLTISLFALLIVAGAKLVAQDFQILGGLSISKIREADDGGTYSDEYANLIAQTSEPAISNHPDYRAIRTLKDHNVVLYQGKQYRFYPELEFTLDNTNYRKNYFTLSFKFNMGDKPTTILVNLATEHVNNDKPYRQSDYGEIRVPSALYRFDTNIFKKKNIIKGGKVSISLKNEKELSVNESKIKSGYIQIENPFNLNRRAYKILAHFELENEQAITFYLNDEATMTDKTKKDPHWFEKFMKTWVRGIIAAIIVIVAIVTTLYDIIMFLAKKMNK